MPIWPKAGQSQAYQRLRRELSGLARSMSAGEAGIPTWLTSPTASGNRMVSQATSTKEPAFADLSSLARLFRRPTGTTPHEFGAQHPGSLTGRRLVSACGDIRLHGRREQTLQFLHNSSEAVGAQLANIGSAQWL
jgi:hypothetical protein